MLVTGVLIVSACGSHNNASGGGTGTSAPPVKVTCGGKPDLKASGSTAQKNAMTEFVKAFANACPGQSLDYTADDSSAGINEFLDSKNDFGGSDSVLSRDEYDRAQQRCGSPTWNLPMVVSPIAIAFNVNGVTSLESRRSDRGPNLQRPDQHVERRRDRAAEPGRANFPTSRSTSCSAATSPGPPTTSSDISTPPRRGTWGFPAGRKFNGGVGEGAVGNDGAADKVKNTEGSVTYLAWSFAQAQHLNTASIITSAGPDPVAISQESVGKTMSSAWFIKKGDDLALDTISFYRPNQPGAYPIVLATYEIVCSKYPDPKVGEAVRAFLQSAIGPGQKSLTSAGYIPIPDEFKPRLLNSINAIS